MMLFKEISLTEQTGVLTFEKHLILGFRIWIKIQDGETLDAFSN